MFLRKAAGFRRALALLVGCAAVLVGATAQAYVRAISDNVSPYFWAEPRQALSVARAPDNIGISDADLRAAAKAAIESWSYPHVPCTAVSLRLEDGLAESRVVGRNGINRIVVQVDEWCRDPVDMTESCGDPNALALTSIVTLQDGKILEADIAINALGWAWAVIPDGREGDFIQFEQYDLASVLTHEMGHFLGLDHSCASEVTAEVDDQGHPVPACGSPAARQVEIEAATMYPRVDPASVKVRTLTPDDSRAACEIYPALVNDWGGGGGCAVSPGRASLAAAGSVMAPSALLTAAILASRPRRRRRDVFVARGRAR